MQQQQQPNELMSFNDVAAYFGRTRQKIHEYKCAYPDLFRGLTVYYDENKPAPKAHFGKEAFLAWARQYPNAVTAIRMGKPGLAVVFTKRTFSTEEATRLLSISHCGVEYKRLMASTPGACASYNAKNRSAAAKTRRDVKTSAAKKAPQRSYYGKHAPDGMLTVQQVADLLGLAYKTVGKKAKRGDFGNAAKQINGLWYFDEAEIRKVKLVGRGRPRKRGGGYETPMPPKVGPDKIQAHIAGIEAEIEQLMQKHERLKKEQRKIAFEEFLDALMKGRTGQIIRKYAGTGPLGRQAVIDYLNEHLDALTEHLDAARK